MNLYQYHTNPDKLFGYEVVDEPMMYIGETSGNRNLYLADPKYNADIKGTDIPNYLKKIRSESGIQWIYPSVHDLKLIFQNSGKVIGTHNKEGKSFKMEDDYYWSEHYEKDDTGRANYDIVGLGTGRVTDDYEDYTHFFRPVFYK